MIKFLKWDIVSRQLHWIVWIVITILTLVSYLQTNNFLWTVIATIVNVSAIIIIVYTNVYGLMPLFYEKNKKVTYVFFALVLLFVICIARVEFRIYSFAVFYPNEPDTIPRLQLYATTAVSCIINFIFSIFFRFALNYFKVRKEQKLLKEYTTKVELDLLKAQVQPHFLFNTLNNIYYVAQKQSPETAVLLEKLSNIMRYFVDEAPKNEVLLSIEIQFISDYIDLEKMRIRHPLKLDFRIEGDIKLVKVSPMLIMPLVENVFKHGIDKRNPSNLLVLHIVRHTEYLSVKVSNQIVSAKKQKQAGGGLQNLRNRLQLLYADQFDLAITEKDDCFIANLNIPC